MKKVLEKRSLSGMFFRFKNLNTDSMENRCFEDLPEEEQEKIMEKANPEFVKGIAKGMAQKLRKLGDEFDITCEQP